MQNGKLKVAFIKFIGAAAGGSERFMQIIAANLPKDRFEVDYFYCDAVPYIGAVYQLPDTDLGRLAYLKSHGVKTIKFHLQAKDITTPLHTWVGTDFWEHFNEKDYDLIQIARAGHKEYPFNKIRHTPIIDSIHLTAGVDNQYNISKVMHLNQWSVDKWAAAGGDRQRAVIVINPVDIPYKNYPDLRQELNLADKFVYGFHQRPHDSLFSNIPLKAYKQVEDEHTAFVLLGGGESYRQQAKELNLKNIYFLSGTGDSDRIYCFLASLNVYAHGRKDGEVNSRSMGEAMYFGLPIVSHLSPINNGHVESIGNAGVVVASVEEYVKELNRLRQDKDYYRLKSVASKKRFAERFALNTFIKEIVLLYEEVYKNPFPHPFKRIVFGLHWTQNIRIVLAWVYLKLKYKLDWDLKKIF